MDTDALKAKLKELHTALAGAQGSADAELQQLLHQLDGDIRALRQNADSGLASRAQSISARFSAQHPHLAPALRELTDMLSSMGI